MLLISEYFVSDKPGTVQLRKLLQVSFSEQRRNWVKQHQDDLENLTITQLQQKYKRGRYAIRSYQKLLNEMKQNTEV